MTSLNESESIFRATQRTEDAIDAIPWEAIDCVHTPFDKPLAQIVTGSHSHSTVLPSFNSRLLSAI